MCYVSATVILSAMFKYTMMISNHDIYQFCQDIGDRYMAQNHSSYDSIYFAMNKNELYDAVSSNQTSWKEYGTVFKLIGVNPNIKHKNPMINSIIKGLIKEKLLSPTKPE